MFEKDLSFKKARQVEVILSIYMKNLIVDRAL